MREREKVELLLPFVCAVALFIAAFSSFPYFF